MIGGNVTEIKITPQTYIDMNKEFEEEGTPFTIAVPTQEAIDKHRSATPIQQPVRHTVDMVADMWAEHNRIEEERKLQLELDL
ncbi:hypothetical protein SWTG_00110 [Synechococcus phage S-RIM2 R1_1999]|uniref:Uncharacterized protein n=2 Tax=Nerrivikvirus srim2 TaxID=2734125 RepID=A0A1D7RA80_9CAUD|nr:hypothetical protein SWTG_00110 [Synechococcus phage S-RIM2 R1_1999]AGH07241.1 hypothetical protein SWTG_00110 [Synechococcus phage S-RIM2 R1_1999]AON98295.1 hypothetical protein LIS011010_140 [Synechococcus phage S-RIM2]AOO05144.1 hypothetical protein RW120113_139 [Synechococcus phage S-RIM2]